MFSRRSGSVMEAIGLSLEFRNGQTRLLNPKPYTLFIGTPVTRTRFLESPTSVSGFVAACRVLGSGFRV